ncbi:MAG: hypothetical protein GEU82_11640 [Luteitalea sp.]|nr:hypothetical protein [Luteitalea sp.]
MNLARFTVAATLIGSILGAGTLAAQTAPPMKSVLAGKKFSPPVRGEALIEFTAPVTKPIPGKNLVQTTITVRNGSLAPVARLQITESWFDKAGAIVASGRKAINGLLQPGEVQIITIETPYNKQMNGNSFNFTHANGTVKTARVPKLEAPTPGEAEKK